MRYCYGFKKYYVAAVLEPMIKLAESGKYVYYWSSSEIAALKVTLQAKPKKKLQRKAIFPTKKT